MTNPRTREAGGGSVIEATRAHPLSANPPTTEESLKSRLRTWTIVVFAATLVVLMALDVAQERRQMVELETGRASALLAHLAEMPELHQTRQDALARLRPLRELLTATGADLELVPVKTTSPAGDPTAKHVLASRRLTLSEGAVELRYAVDSRRYGEMANRSVVTHVVYGLLALAALVAGFEWILRRHLEGPLKRIAHQLQQIRRGGWTPRLPKTDREFEELSQTIASLGPTLESQVHQWIEVERRVAIADVLRSLHWELEEPHRRVLAVASDLQANQLVASEPGMKLRALLDDLDRISRVLADQEQRRLGSAVSPQGARREDHMTNRTPRATFSLTVAVIAATGIAGALAGTSPAATAARRGDRSAARTIRAQAEQYIDYWNAIPLNAAQERVKAEALNAIKAPCCSEYTMATCCCPCNLAKTVWGLSHYLIAKKSYAAPQVRKAALAWLGFINPGGFTGNACFTGGCPRPFAKNGCGGMEATQLILGDDVQ